VRTARVVPAAGETRRASASRPAPVRRHARLFVVGFRGGARGKRGVVRGIWHGDRERNPAI